MDRTNPSDLSAISRGNRFFESDAKRSSDQCTGKAKEYFRRQSKEDYRKLYLKRRRYCLLYYGAGDPRAYDGRIDMEVEWWGPCSEIFSTVNNALCSSNSTLGAADASPTHALLHDRLADRWWLAPFQECQRFVREQNKELP